MMGRVSKKIPDAGKIRRRVRPGLADPARRGPPQGAGRMIARGSPCLSLVPAGVTIYAVCQRPSDPETAMPARLKRLVGAIVILLFVLAYALVAAFIGDVVAMRTPTWVQIVYFAVAGLLWIVPVGLVIRWMYARKPA